MKAQKQLMYLQESFWDFDGYAKKKGYDLYETATCPGFWVRRSIDGTDDEFYELLTMTIQVFDPGFLVSSQKD